MPWLILLSDIKEKIGDMDKACSFQKKGSLRWVPFFFFGGIPIRLSISFFGIINAETARKEGMKMREALDMAADGLCIGNHVVLYGLKWLS